jgi:hypothetical protein
MIATGGSRVIRENQPERNAQRECYGASGGVAVTGGLATLGDTVGCPVDDLVVSPVVISVVLGAVKVPGSDTIVPPCVSVAATVSAPPMATMALPPTTPIAP